MRIFFILAVFGISELAGAAGKIPVSLLAPRQPPLCIPRDSVCHKEKGGHLPYIEQNKRWGEELIELRVTYDRLSCPQQKQKLGCATITTRCTGSGANPECAAEMDVCFNCAQLEAAMDWRNNNLAAFGHHLRYNPGVDKSCEIYRKSVENNLNLAIETRRISLGGPELGKKLPENFEKCRN